MQKEKILSKTNAVNGVAVLLRFLLFFGPNGLIRPAGRIKRLVEVDYVVKHLIVHDARHAFVKLFLRHTHFKHHHQGIDYLWAKIQECYTILKLRSSLRSFKSNWATCRKFRAATIQQIMADLPVERLAYQSPPFTNTVVSTSAPFTLLYVGQLLYWEEVGFPLHILNYSCSSCWNRSIHGRQFVFSGSRVVRLPSGYTCHCFVGQWH